MMLLRKVGKQTSNLVLSDLLVGSLDSTNQIFTVSQNYATGSIEVIYNGQVLTNNIDFEETGPNEITFIYLKPDNTSVLTANYKT